MFETLNNSEYTRFPDRPAIQHIIHIAASEPDAMVNPVWNDQPSFDSLTWNTLPNELKKVSLFLLFGKMVPHL